ncbi:MAG: VWA domain-containing protein [Lachnospiraceae bacterium]|nr:VWA domain-containing protein [Lachnospiraceae bacterium]
MAIDFTKPIMLLMLPLVIIFIIFAAKGSSKGFKKNLQMSVRSTVCLLLILAVTGMSIKTYTDTTTTIFAADLSASLNDAESTSAEYIKEAIKHKSKKDLAGVVAFGGNAVVEVSPANEINLNGFNAYIEEDSTNIEKAIKIASGLIDQSSEKRIVLISDGNETESQVLKQASSLSAQGIVVDGVLLENTIEKEVQITSLITPNYMDKNTKYDIEVVANSLTDTPAVLKVFKGNTLAVNQNVSLRKGENRFLFSDISAEGGGIIYRAEIEAEADTLYENNKAYSYTYVEDTPAVLIIENSDNSGREMQKILESSKVKTKLIKSSEAPKSIENLNLWDAVVLADVSAEELSQEFLTSLEAFVKTTGGGFIVTGGENSYALGSYTGTVLQDILPVTMELETEGEKPDLGMVMVIDHSGSMSDSNYGVSRMEMAKEAAMRAVEVMEAKDSIGVVAFDSEPTWTVELQKIGENTDSIVNKIGGIQPQGGTSILPALNEAFNVLSKADTKLKHIILLTDGQAEQTGYEGLLEKMKAAGITLSTVAVGSGADVNLLSDLAKKGEGRYYFTNEFTNLPQIFTKETTIAGKEYINNRTFYPQAQDASQILSGIDAVAQLKGYIGATLKPRADAVLVSDTEEPILSTWQYGLGRTAAWTSDMSGRWTDEWLDSNEGTQIIRNLVSWVMRSKVSAEIEFSGEKSGDTSIITASMPYNSNVTQVSAVVVSADNKETKLEMKAAAPGIYSGETTDISEGGYIISLSLTMKDGSIETQRGGFNIQYPAEYDLRKFSEGRDLLEKLTAQTGGRMVTSPQDVFSEKIRTSYTDKDLSTILIVLALLLFLFDVAIRRFSVISEKLEKLLRWIFKRKTKVPVKMEFEKPVMAAEEKKEEIKKTEKKNTEKPVIIQSTASILASKKKKR